MAQQSPPDPETCTVLYKILTPDDKRDLPAKEWAGTELDVGVRRKDGFIHLSNSHQLPGTLSRFFGSDSGVGDRLFLLALPRASITDASNRLKFEPAAGTLFGHVYGTLNPDADFAQTYELSRDQNGTFAIPELPF